MPMHHALFGRACRDGDTQQPGALLDQGDAASRAGTAEWLKILPHGTTARRHHLPPLGIASDIMQAYLVPIGFQLLGNDTRQRRADMLAYFRLGNIHGDDAVAVDLEPDAGVE